MKNLNKIVNKMSNIKPFIIEMEPKDTIKPDAIDKGKYETYKDELLPDDGLYRYLW